MKDSARAFRKRKKETAHVEMTSLIDVIFILLIFFMISSTFLKPATRIRLPVSATKEEIPQDEDKIIVTLTADDLLFVEKKQVSLDEFQPALRERLEENSNVVVLFYGDEEIEYKKFLFVMDIIKSIGIKGVAIGHESE